jgi:phage-related minor tail protein
MARKPPPRTGNVLIDKIPAAKRRAIQEACVRQGTSIEKIPAWMLLMAPKKIEYRLKLHADSVRANTAAQRKNVEAKARAKTNAKSKADARVKAKAEAKARADARAVARAEARAKAEAEARAKAEAEARAKAEAEARAKAEAEARAKAEAEARAKAEAEARAKAEAKAGKPGTGKKPKLVPMALLMKIKIPNTLTGQRAKFWIKEVLPRVGNRTRKHEMYQLILGNLGLPLPEFERVVEKQLDEMLTKMQPKRKPEEDSF